jgi:N4-gp56 family major capsid protein
MELIKNAIDSNAFISTTTTAGYINPEVWNRQVLRHVEEVVVVSPLAKVYDDILGAAGDTINVTIDVEPTAASALTETTAVTIDAMTNTQVVFTPTEYGAAYQLSDKEARRAFYDVAGNMAKKLGYRLAVKRESAAITELTDNAGNSIVANGVASSAIASSDTMDYDDIVDAKKKIMEDKLIPRYLVVSVGQLAQLQKTAAFRDASQFGGRETILGGELKVVGGLTVMWSTLIQPSSSKSKALMLGVDLSGEAPFGIARKKLPSIASERDELGRFTNFVAVEEYQIKMLRANGVCTIQTYDA